MPLWKSSHVKQTSLLSRLNDIIHRLSKYSRSNRFAFYRVVIMTPNFDLEKMDLIVLHKQAFLIESGITN